MLIGFGALDGGGRQVIQNPHHYFIDEYFQKLDMAWITELKKLKLDTRNKVRAFLEADEKHSIKLLNKLRAERSPREILQIESVLRQYALKREVTIPHLFPKQPQTLENYHRLNKLEFSKKLKIIDGLVSDNYVKLCDFFRAVSKIDKAIISKDVLLGSQTISQVYAEFGYSHFLFRKAVLLRSFNTTGTNLAEVEDLLGEAGFKDNNVIVTSLIHCYKEEQDFLSLKKSIMNLQNRRAANKFTRDICRISFHPLAKDNDDLTDLLQSCLQSSLIDAVIIAKINTHLVSKLLSDESMLLRIFDDIERGAESIDDIASLYSPSDPDNESIFYKHTSAWLENADVVRYRTLLDHFYDFPESDYFEINGALISRVEEWVAPLELSQLSKANNLSRHNFSSLKLIEVSGHVTRSSIFNYYVHINKGYSKLDESDLVELMGQTRDLAKTINPEYLSNLAQLTDSKLSQLILYLLIAKKSKNELYDHRLRKVFQEIVVQSYGGNIVNLLDALNKRSEAISSYTYEITTEDFIAKLYHLIKSTSEITETRASLHKWMGQLTGEKVYLDRARTILIDHQLNKIRNEIDDNRIYVDSARFAEWINDEVMSDVNGVLTSLEHNSTLLQAENPQLIEIVERCYVSFYSNKIFGITSYLGRRIRHGTFKGHLYSSVVKIERTPKYHNLLGQTPVAAKWAQWKSEYETKIDEIIRTRLHVESNSKRDGLLKLNLNQPLKQELVSLCAKQIARTFAETKSSAGTPQIVTEYCWSLAEIDLRNINSFLKNQKTSLTNQDVLSELKASANSYLQPIATEFCRELVHSINEKLTSMYNWFKRPLNVSPKASLSLLYKAVVAEVKETFPDFETDTEFEPDDDIVLIGGAYLTLYDALYVIVYNAAKHGKTGEHIQRQFNLANDNQKPEKKMLVLTLTSLVKDSESDEYINSRLSVKPGEDINDAQVSEDRSGIRKLHHLEQTNRDFSIVKLCCQDRKVEVALSYSLVA